jgi:hypothetical protein
MSSEAFRIQGRRTRFRQGMTLAFSVCLLLGVVMAIVPGPRPSASTDSPSRLALSLDLSIMPSEMSTPTTRQPTVLARKQGVVPAPQPTSRTYVSLSV